jgi:hypothetical protein
MSASVQCLMDARVNVSCINVIYTHVHHGEWCPKRLVYKIQKIIINFAMACIFVTMPP